MQCWLRALFKEQLDVSLVLARDTPGLMNTGATRSLANSRRAHLAQPGLV